MSYRFDSELSPVNRRYRIVMERALSARRSNDMERYQQLINEAEVLLRHIRKSSHLQVEPEHAQRAAH